MKEEALKQAQMVFNMIAIGDNLDWIKYQAAQQAESLRKALAQPQQEPVALEPNDADLLEAFTRSNNGPNPFYRCNICGDTEPGVREYLVAHWLKHNTSPPQPQQEPVALRDAVSTVLEGFTLSQDVRKILETAYFNTTPPPAATQHERKPLTDEEISDLWCEASNTDFVTVDTHVFARAIEAAHCIKENT